MKNSDDTKFCFVISPIGATGSPERNHADWLLQGIIEPVFANHFPEFIVERSDKISTPGMIDSQVIMRLIDAELVIADMSFQNANAFYEMAIRHMQQRPIVHMYRQGEKIPFDVAPHRAIAFSYTHPGDLSVAQDLLRRAIDATTKSDFVVDNPITRARGFLQIKERATPEARLLLDEISSLRDRLDQIQRMRGLSFNTLIKISVTNKENPLDARKIHVVSKLLRASFGSPWLVEYDLFHAVFAVRAIVSQDRLKFPHPADLTFEIIDSLEQA
jgi:hypothetical protein